MPSLLSDVQTVPVAELTPFPGNPRKGNVAAIAESLQANAQFSPLVVQKSTGYVLAGNHTLAGAISLGWETVSVVFVDVGDVEARKIVLASNRTADLGTPRLSKHHSTSSQRRRPSARSVTYPPSSTAARGRSISRRLSAKPTGSTPVSATRSS